MAPLHVATLTVKRELPSYILFLQLFRPHRIHSTSMLEVIFLRVLRSMPKQSKLNSGPCCYVSMVTACRCGYATLHDVIDKTQEDRMESFFLSETTKYLYLVSTSPLIVTAGGSVQKNS